MRKKGEIGGFFDFLLVIVAILLVGVIVMLAMKYSNIGIDKETLEINISGSAEEAERWISRLINDCYKKKHTTTEDCFIFRLELNEEGGVSTERIAELIKPKQAMYWDERSRGLDYFYDGEEYKIGYNFNNKEVEVRRWGD